MFRVFLGAPSKVDVQQDPSSYHWQTVSSKSSAEASQLPLLPPATLEAASRRISLIYQNIIFDDAEDEQEYHEEEVLENDEGRGAPIRPVVN
jgi:hypothetical protein